MELLLVSASVYGLDASDLCLSSIQLDHPRHSKAETCYWLQVLLRLQRCLHHPLPGGLSMSPPYSPPTLPTCLVMSSGYTENPWTGSPYAIPLLLAQRWLEPMSLQCLLKCALAAAAVAD